MPAKTCAHCGNSFEASGKEYLCFPCHKPSGSAVYEKNRNTGILTFREQQIVTLIKQAKANKQIAFELCLTPGTVKEYLYHIFRKLNVSNRTELAIRF